MATPRCAITFRPYWHHMGIEHSVIVDELRRFHAWLAAQQIHTLFGHLPHLTITILEME